MGYEKVAGDHFPVLLKEALYYLEIKPGFWYVDATLGGGGHAKEILKAGGNVVGLDVDPEAVEESQRRLDGYSVALLESDKELGQDGGKFKFCRAILVNENFIKIGEIVEKLKLKNKIAGILFDLGVSSYQLETAKRGFSFSREGPLDMRMNRNLTVSASDLVNGLSKEELTLLFSKYGEEKRAGQIANAIIRSRKLKTLSTTRELADVVVKITGRRGKIHPATRVFQALRIAVNDEINNLEQVLPKAIEILKPNGRLVFISFHSLEDRLIKNFIKNSEKSGSLENLLKKPLTASFSEIKINPGSRSAKLRAALKKNEQEKS